MELCRGRTATAKVQEALQPTPPGRRRKAPAKRDRRPKKLPACPASRPPSTPLASHGVEVQEEEEAVLVAQEQQVQTPEQPSFYGQTMDEFMRTPSEGEIPNLQSQASIVRFEDEVNSPRRQTTPFSEQYQTGRSSSVPGPSQRPRLSQTTRDKRRALSTSPVENSHPSDVRLALQVKVNRVIIYSRHYNLWNIDIKMVKADITENTQEYYRKHVNSGTHIKSSISSHLIAIITVYRLKNPIH